MNVDVLGDVSRTALDALGTGVISIPVEESSMDEI